MHSAEEFSAIAALDLELIKQKLMHRKAGKGWSPERADTVEREYRRFLYLLKRYPEAAVAPVADVDLFWHHHIVNTKKYAADCQRVFGYFLHRFPYTGMRGKEDEEALQRIAAQTRALYESTFGAADAKRLAALGNGARIACSSAVRLGAAYGSPKTPSCAAPANAAGDCLLVKNMAIEACPGWRNQRGTARDGTQCLAETPQPTSPATFLAAENRAGFYLNRPRLPDA